MASPRAVRACTECIANGSNTEKAAANTEKADAEKADTEKADAGTADTKTEKADTAKAGTGKAGAKTEKAAAAKADAKADTAAQHNVAVEKDRALICKLRHTGSYKQLCHTVIHDAPAVGKAKARVWLVAEGLVEGYTPTECGASCPRARTALP